MTRGGPARMRIDRAAWPFIAILAVAALLVSWWSVWAAAAPLALLAFTLNFFRDPDRVTPAEPGALISPADGRVIRADGARISVFMNVFDVHVCRAPVGGRVVSVRHHPGDFVAAFRDEASEHNERTTIELAPEGAAPVAFTLVAGLVARRIVCRTAEGCSVAAGERIGLIRFGSRVDLDLPRDAAPVVAVGDRVVAGETVLARVG